MTDLSLLHPVLRARVEAMMAEPRMRGLLTVVSATRTQAEQIYLWEGYQKKLAGIPGYGHFNTAANPYSALPTDWYGLGMRYGSWHMQQPDGYGYAVDFGYSQLPADIKAVFIDVAREYRLVETVLSPQYEPWHYQMDPADYVWTPEEPMTEDDRQWVLAQLKATEQRINKAQNDDRRKVGGAGSITRQQLEKIVGLVEETKSQTEANATSIAAVLLRIPKGIPWGGYTESFRQIKAKLGI